MAFKNPFFSLAGQRERFRNVADVVGISAKSILPWSKDRVRADVKSKKLKGVLEFVANNPYTVAGIATGAGALFKGGAKAGIERLGRFVAGSFKRQPLKAAAVTGAGVIGAGALATSSKARKVAGRTLELSTPEGLSKTGGKLGEFIGKPSGSGFVELVGRSLPAAAVGAAAVGLPLAGAYLQKRLSGAAGTAARSEVQKCVGDEVHQ
jgi:hypothetical protein